MTAGSNSEELVQKFQSTLADPSGLPLCVVLSDVWWFRYFADKTIIALDPLIKQLQWDLSDYHESLANDYQYASKQ